MKKLLVITGFASDGIGHRLNLMFNAFPKKDVDITTLCLNRIIGMKSSKEFLSGDYIIRDLSFYNTINLRKVIINHNPDFIVLIAARQIIDRLAIIVGQKEKIPVVFIQHGMIWNSYSDDGKSVISTDRIIVSYKNIYKYLQYLRVYFKSIIFPYFFSKIIIHELKYISRFVLKPKMNIRYYQVSDVKANHALLYSPYDKDFFKQRGYNDNQINILGYPSQQEKLSNVFSIPEVLLDQNIILYIGGLSLIKQYDWSETEELKFLTTIKKIVTEHNFIFIYKVHPDQSIDRYKMFSDNSKMFFLEKADLIKLIKDSDLIISQMSTVLNYAIVQNKPIIIPKLNKKTIYTVEYAKFNIGQVCDFSDLEDTILQYRKKVKINKLAYKKYIDYNIGKINHDYSKDILNFFKSTNKKNI